MSSTSITVNHGNDGFGEYSTVVGTPDYWLGMCKESGDSPAIPAKICIRTDIEGRVEDTQFGFWITDDKASLKIFRKIVEYLESLDIPAELLAEPNHAARQRGVAERSEGRE